jgi:cysteine synthase
MKRSRSSTLPSLPTFSDLIGQTPLLDVSDILPEKERARGIHIVAKAEFMNPGLSLKDRIVSHILGKAEEEGKLKKGGTVICASSGNTGAATAMLCAMRGYRCLVLTSPKCSDEKRRAIEAYGATLVIVASDYDVKAAALAKEHGYFDIDQYENTLNREAHYATLGAEIYEQTAGAVTHWVSGASTGGHITGVSMYLKGKNEKIQTVLADPVGSVLLDSYRGSAIKAKADRGTSILEGVGKGRVPGNVDFAFVDKAVRIEDQDAIAVCRRLAEEQGILAGGSSGLNVAAALKVATDAPDGSVIACVLCDSGVKYLSKIYNNEFVNKAGLTTTRRFTIKVPKIV